MKLTGKCLLLLACMISVCSYAQQEEHHIPTENKDKSCEGSCCCDGNSQAPLGVMTDHIHDKGTWMLSYSYMNTRMKGNRIGAKQASDAMVYQNYMMSPETMNMTMHMAMLMYGVTDRLTLMAMGGYMTNSMNMNMDTAGGMMFMNGQWMSMPGYTNPGMQTSTSGFTDTKLSALYNFSNKANQRIIGSLGISLPTGSINATGTTLLGDNQRVPYDMQISTGSYSLAPGITYVRKKGLWYFGADAGADLKLNFNSLGYRVGNSYHASTWAGYQLLPWVSATLRAEGVHTARISGSDSVIAIPVYQTSDPTTKTSNYGGDVVNLYLGFNFHIMKPVLDKFRILAEYGMPVYQNLNGTQMALKSNLYLGVQYSF